MLAERVRSVEDSGILEKTTGTATIAVNKVTCKKNHGLSQDAGKFLELFAGMVGLTKAVLARGLAAHEAWDLVDGSTGMVKPEFDLRRADHFEKVKSLIKNGSVAWIHGAPPCKTFSRARRSGECKAAAVH